MDPGMEQLRQTLVEVETEAEELLLARHQANYILYQQLVENDRLRNGNGQALTVLRRRAQTTMSSVPSPFEVIMREIEGAKALVKEICPTCGDHDSKEHTWMMFPGSYIFVRMPFHATHTTLEKDQEWLVCDTKKLQSYVKEKSLLISKRGALADWISPDLVKSMVTLTDTPKST
ncbi:uncharacterized protein LOC122010610 [Zingiber officinale]|uniref:uncharacterized protein LOC122010610 n=1 Tax=Zingiber officinale TaxID=94328 RepID=UPI001C4C779B|nr:uncharacterized protein LOC122010610 [Zingiber officinale]